MIKGDGGAEISLGRSQSDSGIDIPLFPRPLMRPILTQLPFLAQIENLEVVLHVTGTFLTVPDEFHVSGIQMTALHVQEKGSVSQSSLRVHGVLSGDGESLRRPSEEGILSVESDAPPVFLIRDAALNIKVRHR